MCYGGVLNYFVIFVEFICNRVELFYTFATFLNKLFNKRNLSIKILNMEVIKTIREIEREKMHSRICQMYIETKEKHPEFAPSRIFLSIATSIGWTLQGVRKVLIQNNLYKGEEK